MKKYISLLLVLLFNFGLLQAEPVFYHNIGQTYLLSNGQQAVHSQTNIIYVNQNETITLHRPDKDTYKAYLRWYNYDTDKAAENVTTSDTYYYTTNDGLFVIPHTSEFALKYIMQDKVYRIAADQSAYKDYDVDATNDTYIKEPTLSKRLIYEMRPASEIASRIDTCVGNSYLEYHKLMAPTGRQIYIGPNYYFADQYCSSSEYSYTTRSNYYYGASNPTRMSTTSNWIWSIDGTKTSFTPITGQFIAASSNSIGTITYTLQYKVGSITYNVAKFEVTYLDVNSVGPLETLTNNDVSGMDIIYENTFNYNKPNTTDLTWYDGHISIDESSYGYFYKDLISYHFVNGQYDDVYWSEYGFVNKHKSWCNESTYGYNHGSTNSEADAKDGYFLYCDGSENPGKIFSLNIDEDLCAGSVMYFSAWVMDLSYYGSYNSPCAPNIDFVIVGVKDDGTEDVITTFTTGEFGKAVSMETATWYQVLFPITFDNVNSKYDSYKIRINNKGKSASGNDFGFDDIRIYIQKRQLLQYKRPPMIVLIRNMIPL